METDGDKTPRDLLSQTTELEAHEHLQRVKRFVQAIKQRGIGSKFSVIGSWGATEFGSAQTQLLEGVYKMDDDDDDEAIWAVFGGNKPKGGYETLTLFPADGVQYTQMVLEAITMPCPGRVRQVQTQEASPKKGSAKKQRTEDVDQTKHAKKTRIEERGKDRKQGVPVGAQRSADLSRKPPLQDLDEESDDDLAFQDRGLERQDSRFPQALQAQPMDRTFDMERLGDMIVQSNSNLVNKVLHESGGGRVMEALCKGLRVPAEVDYPFTALYPNFWIGTGATPQEWRDTFAALRFELGVQIVNPALRKELRIAVATLAGYAVATTPPQMKGEWELPFAHCSTVARVIAAVLSTSSMTDFRSKYDKAWRDGRIDFEALLKLDEKVEAEKPAASSKLEHDDLVKAMKDATTSAVTAAVASITSRGRSPGTGQRGRGGYHWGRGYGGNRNGGYRPSSYSFRGRGGYWRGGRGGWTPGRRRW